MSSKLLPCLRGYMCPYRATTAEDDAQVEAVDC